MISLTHSKRGRCALIAIVAMLVVGLAADSYADRSQRRGRRGRGGDSGETRGSSRGGRGGGAAEVKIADAGSIKGKITLKGEAPKELQLNVAGVMTPQCADTHSEPVFTRRVVANDKGELKDVLVWVESGLPEGQELPRNTEDVILDQEGCMYHPSVFAFQTGQKFTIKNSDPFLHNVHAVGEDGSGKDYFNQAMPKVMDIDKTGEFRAKDTPVKFKCEVHAWMFAYAAVLEHPYFAVTDENGDYEIPNLPPGTYTLKVWQRKAGEQTLKVEVPANGEAEANAVYDFTAAAE